MDARDIDLTCLARVSGAGGTGGVGFYLAPNTVLTSAHVVNLAIGLEPDHRGSKVGRTVSLNLPIDSDRPITATVEKWKSPSASDLAILSLEDDPKDVSLPPVWLGSSDFDDPVPVLGWGFPDSDQRDAQPAGGQVTGKMASSRLVISPSADASEDLLGLGFSGTPVWAEVSNAPRIIGILTHARTGRRPKAAVLPMHRVSRALYPGAARRASTAWYCDRFKSDLLEAFISDLRGLRVPGLDPQVCDVVYEQLGKMEDKLSGLTYAGEQHDSSWQTAPYRRMRELRQAYRIWNDAAVPDERGRLIDPIVDQRARLTSQLSQVRSLEIIADQNESGRIFRGLVLDFADLGNTYPDEFPVLRRTLARLQKKERGATAA